MAYPHSEIDDRWQKKWADAKCFEARLDASKPKYYALDMFPYPSGAGLHVGHLASYTPTDIVSRFKRARGFNVLHPMGYDAFGLPAEQYAIQTGIHPAITTEQAISNFRRQLKSYGFSFDWNREVSTCDPSFYKWTQFIFIKLFERGLAYQKEAPVNWCPALKTVLANEEVVDGKSERGGHPVIRVKMRQWMLKITDYAEKLLAGLDQLDWPEASKEGQRNWIGKSEGALVQFQVKDLNQSFQVFTTRPDTLFGVTFMVLAPEHPLIDVIVPTSHKSKVREYIEISSRKSEVDRKVATEKSGVFSGAYATHPLTSENIPIWIADYVLVDYGTGAIMAVPGHDQRDFEFAKTYQLPIPRVLESESDLPFVGDGVLCNSEFLNGLPKQKAISRAIEEIEKRKLGTRQVQYKFRDWLFSRQRYWGEPIPILYDQNNKTSALAMNELPLTLPEVADYEPSEKGEPPLARVESFIRHKSGLRRDADTMPGSAGSSWYFLRYTDPQNDKEPFSFEAQKYWMPVDLYVGGKEHTVGHLLYSRFWHKVLFDCGLVSTEEPFKKLAHQGVIMGPDGQRMSKSRGNVVNPDEVREKYGADAVRMYISFLGPFEKDKPWDSGGIEGVKRFLDRLWRLVCDDDGRVIAKDESVPDELERLLHKTIKKVTEDLESMNFNTAISAMMIYLNELYRANLKPRESLKTLTQLLAPFAPHFCEELWSKMGGTGFVSLAPWPTYNETLTIDDSLEMGVQVNGKLRGSIRVTLQTPESDALSMARSINTVANALGSMAIAKVIYKPGKILNIIGK